MRPEELRFVCEEAARDLVARRPRPLPPHVVLPAAPATRVVELEGFPDDDAGRLAYLDRLVAEEILPETRPAYGFLAEAEAAGVDVLLVVYGATGLAPQLTAAPFAGEGQLGDFAEPEPLAVGALPFLHPLQHAVDAAR